MRMIDEDEVGLKEKAEDTRYIKMITSKLGVWAKELDPNITMSGTADSGKCRCVTPEGTQRGCEISRRLQPGF